MIFKRKKTTADKIADKAFNNPKVKSSWEVHEQAFGPILTPAFVDDTPSRVRLTAALNYISRGDLQKGLNKLNELKKFCINDADNAAWFFCVGLVFDMSGQLAPMMYYYNEANKLGHNFYLPYLKVAKLAHEDGVFEMAEENYLNAINCFDEDDLTLETRKILASIHTNRASNFTMMHKYDDAKLSIADSKRILPQQPGRPASEAMLYAALGDKRMTDKSLSDLEYYTPEMVEAVKEHTDAILGGTDDHFCIVDADHNAINDFWEWFAENCEPLMSMLEDQAYDEVLETITEKLMPCFPFMKRDVNFGISNDNGVYTVELQDYYSVSLRHGFERLIEVMPCEFSDHWRFEIVHYGPEVSL